MVAHVTTVAFQGIEAEPVDVQVHIGAGMPAFAVVGLPDKAVGESRDRVRAALSSLGLSLPARRITVNLAPADILKEGSHFDLPIALGLLIAMNVLPEEELSGYAALGELGLDGALIGIAGVLPAAIAANAKGLGLICPAANGGEAAWGGGADVLAPASLLALINHFKGTQLLGRPEPVFVDDSRDYPDLRDVKGQETAKRAIEIAAAGGHHLLMIGPPGAGKSMLAARLAGILPPLEPEEALEVSLIASVAGQLVNGRLTRRRPFRDPHHSISMPAMVGGGLRAKPGEVSLAHQGVLFLDELPEFPRQVLDALRQPIETGRVTVARANAHVSYFSRFSLICAMNPCRCGHLADAARACTRAPKCAVEYQSRISGPLYDRIDLHVEVSELSANDLALPPPSEGSAEIAARVARVRAAQASRYKQHGAFPRVRTNAEAEGELLEKVAAPDAAGRTLLGEAVDRLKLSARGYHRVMRVARTLADLEGADTVRRLHIAEALSYRRIELPR